MEAVRRHQVDEEAWGCVLSFLPLIERSILRGVSSPLRSILNGAQRTVKFTAPQAFHTLASSGVLKRFPRASAMDFCFSSEQDVKAAVMFLLTSPPDQGTQLRQLEFRENRLAAQQQQQCGGGSHPESRYQQYGYRSGARAAPPTFDFTEPVLASVCCLPSVTSVVVDKTALLETEAAALARLSTLERLELSTNSSAQPLRRPLLQLMLGSMPQLRVLKLSYIRDTTADLAVTLSRLPNLTTLTFQYAYWGESGAGERIMCALGKHQKQLAELRLYECCVNDDMLRYIMGLSTLRCLHIQDEDAPEESCPTNKGLSRISQLRRLEQLELFGEELQLDAELLGQLAALPALRHVAMAGLDALHGDDVDSGSAPEGMEDLDAEVEEMELSSAMGDDEETESTSGNSLSMDEVTSRPGNALHRRGATSAFASCGTSALCPQRPANQQQQQQHPTPQHPQRPRAHRANSSPSSSHQTRSTGARRAAAVRLPAGGGGGAGGGAAGSRRAGGGDAAAPDGGDGGGDGTVPAPPAAPMHVLRHLEVLRLYGPSSVGTFPPPLALLLPQPRLRQLKLSACASHDNMRALLRQAGLCKLILSHTNVGLLYPPEPPPAHAPALAAPFAPAAAPLAPCLHHAQPSGAASTGGAGGAASPPRPPSPPLLLAAPPPSPLPPLGPAACSILGLHAEVAAGLASLRILRLKDLPGLADCHLADLAAALCLLPALAELKLRALGLVSDAGVGALAAVTQLRRLKLYGLGDGVTEPGVALLAASLPCLDELKVKECRRVGPSLRNSVAACRAAGAAGQRSLAAAQLPVVRYGPKECEGGREPATKL